jgi:hypothetical protein
LKRPTRSLSRRDRMILLTLKPPSLISQSIQKGTTILKNTWDEARKVLLDFWQRGFSEHGEGSKLRRREIVIDARWKFWNFGAALLPAISLILYMELWGKDIVHRRLKEIQDAELAERSKLFITSETNEKDATVAFGTKEYDKNMPSLSTLTEESSSPESPPDTQSSELSSTVLPSSVERMILLRRLEELELKIKEYDRRWNEAILGTLSSNLKSGISNRVQEKSRVRELAKANAPPSSMEPSWLETGMEFAQQLYHNGQLVVRKLNDEFSPWISSSSSSSSSDSSSSSSLWTWPFRKEKEVSKQQPPENVS